MSFYRTWIQVKFWVEERMEDVHPLMSVGDPVWTRVSRQVRGRVWQRLLAKINR